ncbi:MAG: formylglycine-generating enzyme family protein [Bacteroidales bacterium]|nr:formylglycine-generating enzyme family protein [Bacteroidales bacterium]
MKRMVRMSLLGLLAMSLLASCKKEEKPFVPKEPELQEDYTETAFLTNMEMVYVKGGEFMMGMTPEQGWDRPDSIIKKYTRKTKLDSYHIGKYEVTQAQWKAVMGDDYYGDDDYPKVWIDWEEAQEFSKKLREMTGKKYVLPTQAQWEYAARGGVHDTKTMYAGSNDIDEVAWYEENSKGLIWDAPEYPTRHPVGTKKANALGLYDMSGNVWEYCSDWYINAGYDKKDDYNPQGPDSGSYHVIRGGSFYSNDRECRVSYRYNDNHIQRAERGFRVAVLP